MESDNLSVVFLLGIEAKKKLFSTNGKFREDHLISGHHLIFLERKCLM